MCGGRIDADQFNSKKSVLRFMTDNGKARSGKQKKVDDKVIPEEAFISPDEPMVPDEFRAAVIRPDDPLEPREEEGGVVVGMDGSTEHEAAGAVRLDPDRVAEVLDAISTDLRAKGAYHIFRDRTGCLHLGLGKNHRDYEKWIRMGGPCEYLGATGFNIRMNYKRIFKNLMDTLYPQTLPQRDLTDAL